MAYYSSLDNQYGRVSMTEYQARASAVDRVYPGTFQHDKYVLDKVKVYDF
ncbi:MAG: hypothetical protein ABIC95_05055 [archaeon]